MTFRAEKNDALAIYNLYNTTKSESNSFIDYFFNEVFDYKDYYILKRDGIILALLKVKDEIIHFNNLNIVASVISEFLFADNCPNNLLEDFVSKVLFSLKYKTLLTISKSKFDLSKYGFNDFVFNKKYKLYRSDLFYVNDYYIVDDYNEEMLLDIYREFSSHFDIYLKRDKKYFVDYIKLLKKLNYEIYVIKSNKDKPFGYIVYNYIEGEIQVVELVYLDSIALVGLINQAMGINNYIYINTSSSESLNKIFKNMSFEVDDSMMLKVNDSDLFKRLLRLENKDVKIENYRENSIYLRYY